jgi:hypothetical protein
MTRKVAAIALCAVALLASVLVFVNAIGACRAEGVSIAVIRGDAASCFDYWLNRYQTLLAGSFALAAACVAGYFVYMQVTETRGQTRVMLGDVAPDFVLVTGDELEDNSDFVLKVANHNRRTIEVTSLLVTSPEHLHAWPDPTVIGVLKIESSGKVIISGFVNGTRPSATAPSIGTIRGRLIAKGNPDQTRAENVIMQIGDRIAGNETEETITCMMAVANVSGHER